jgi:hypothetical protein
MLSSISAGAEIAGPVIAGVLVATTGPANAVTIDSMSFFAAAAVQATIHSSFRDLDTSEAPPAADAGRLRRDRARSGRDVSLAGRRRARRTVRPLLHDDDHDRHHVPAARVSRPPAVERQRDRTDGGVGWSTVRGRDRRHRHDRRAGARGVRRCRRFATRRGDGRPAPAQTQFRQRPPRAKWWASSRNP